VLDFAPGGALDGIDLIGAERPAERSGDHRRAAEGLVGKRDDRRDRRMRGAPLEPAQQGGGGHDGYQERPHGDAVSRGS
jgi:hypothetical protein